VKGFFSMSELLKDCSVVMLYSGGADSRLMLELCLAAGKRPHCVLVDYGQKHIAELDYAKKQLEEVGISYQIVSIMDFVLIVVLLVVKQKVVGKTSMK
jgi:7-cyano-7-deazaguanine synthase in queuosine biosynthesis